MAARATWRGAIEVGGFPVNIALYGRVKSRSSDSFKMIAPDGGPVKQVYVTQKDHGRIEKAVLEDKAPPKVLPFTYNECQKGVENGDKLVPLDTEAITSRERSRTVEPKAFVPAAEVPRDLSLAAYKVVPDNKVPGSESGTEIVWNGLLSNKIAYISEIVVRSGSRDSILAIYADKEGLWAVGLPYAEELNELPEYEFSRSTKAAKVFGQLVEVSGLEREHFDHDEFKSEWRKLREKSIAQALKGKLPAAPTDDEAPEPAVDLMAALEAAVAAGPPKQKGGRKQSKQSRSKAAA